MRELSYLYKLLVLGEKMYDKDFLATKDLTRDSFTVLLATNLIAEASETDTVNPKAVRSFLKYYMKEVKLRLFNTQLDLLHQNNLIWINTIHSITITKLGIQAIKQVFNTVMEIEKTALRPILRTLKTGRYKVDGLLVSKENAERKKRNSATPYIGVKRIAPHQFRASLRHNGETINLGTFTRPLSAAKARDAYIRNHKLNLKYSL